MNNVKAVVSMVEKIWSELTYDERENVILAQEIAKKELKIMGICNETIGETLNLIALQLTTLILESRIVVGDDSLTIEQYKERVSFLLNEALDNELIQYLPTLEKLFHNTNGIKLYDIECAIGDYIWGGV